VLSLVGFGEIAGIFEKNIRIKALLAVLQVKTYCYTNA
jgi:hypothetical protein